MKASAVCLETRYCNSGRHCVGPGRASRRAHVVSPGPRKPEALTGDGCSLSQAMRCFVLTRCFLQVRALPASILGCTSP